MKKMEAKTGRKIKFEKITIAVPKNVLDYIKKVHGDPAEWISLEITSWIKFNLETLDPHELAEIFDLTEIFETLLQK
jgi:hypothetical protein